MRVKSYVLPLCTHICFACALHAPSTSQGQFGSGPGDHVLLRQRLKTDDKPGLTNWLGKILCAGPDGKGYEDAVGKQVTTLEELLQVRSRKLD